MMVFAIPYCSVSHLGVFISWIETLYSAKQTEMLNVMLPFLQPGLWPLSGSFFLEKPGLSEDVSAYCRGLGLDGFKGPFIPNCSVIL